MVLNLAHLHDIVHVVKVAFVAVTQGGHGLQREAAHTHTHTHAHARTHMHQLLLGSGQRHC